MSKKDLNVFSANDVNGLTKVIEKLENSQFDYMELEHEDVKIVIGKNGFQPSSLSRLEGIENKANEEMAAPVAAEAEVQEQTVPQKETVPAAEKPAAGKTETITAVEGEVFIKANTAGLFYAQSEPGAPPYVQIGDSINEDTTVGLIEVMKVFSAISAGVSGEITEIHAEDAQLVEYGQPLFTVKTD